MKLILLTALAMGLSSPAMAEYEFEQYAFSNPERSFKTDALLIQKDGKVLFERYANGFNANKKHYLWSISKTISATLVGRAIQEGRIKLDDPVSKYVSAPRIFSRTPDKKNLTVRHLVKWSSTFDYNESYEGGNLTESSVLQQLYAPRASKDMTGYILAHDFIKDPDTGKVYSPGDIYRYSTGDSTLVMSALKGVYGDEYDRMPWTQLFDILGMDRMSFQQDTAGVFIGGAKAFATPRSLVKLGQLFLNDGVWEGRRLLPKTEELDWVKFSWQPNPTFLETPESIVKYSGWTPANSWWMNLDPRSARQAYKATGDAMNGQPEFEGVPKNTYIAIGHWGQYMAIIPEKNLIVVRFGEDRFGDEEAGIDQDIDLGKLLRGILKDLDQLQGGAQ